MAQQPLPPTPSGSTRPDDASWRPYVVIGLIAGGFLLLLFVVLSNDGGKQETETAPGVVKLTSANWKKEVAESKVPVVVDFWAPWCGPCRKVAPVIDVLAKHYAGKVKVAKLNIDDAQDIQARYNVRSIPRVLIFNGGATPVQTYEGLDEIREEVIVATLDRMLRESRTP